MALGPHFDPLGETEKNTTLYTLTVYVPPRLPPRWLPNIFTRKPSIRPNPGAIYKIPVEDTNPNLDCFELKHLDDLPTKTVTIVSAMFPAEMRCKHVQSARVCAKGCYFVEKGGENARWKCGRKDCEGHVYCGRVKKDEEEKACFGEKARFGKEGRLVCLEG